MQLHNDFTIGDKVRVGDKIGDVIKIDHRGNATIFKVAFEEGPAKDFVSPPIKILKGNVPFASFRGGYSLGKLQR
ncbi:MAG: hypothetical protein WBD99_13625 [Thermodesulfobacteriota bacterium]